VYPAGTADIYVSPAQIRRFNLHTGDSMCRGQASRLFSAGRALASIFPRNPGTLRDRLPHIYLPPWQGVSRKSTAGLDGVTE
jgi:transcription termination factor Rho